MAVVLYHYPNCSTCRKARKWLDARNIEYEAVDLVADPPSATRLRQIYEAAGVPRAKLFNTSGVSFREGGFRDRLPSMSDTQAFAALAADGKLIKRPIVVADAGVAIGFSESGYIALFST